MPITKLATDIVTYWHIMQLYHEQASLIGQRYVLDIDMPQFINDCESERVVNLLTAFMNAEKAKLKG